MDIFSVDEWISIVNNVGFPIFLVLLLLFRMENKFQKFTNELKNLKKKE